METEMGLIMEMVMAMIMDRVWDLETEMVMDIIRIGTTILWKMNFQDSNRIKGKLSELKASLLCMCLTMKFR